MSDLLGKKGIRVRVIQGIETSCGKKELDEALNELEPNVFDIRFVNAPGGTNAYIITATK